MNLAPCFICGALWDRNDGRHMDWHDRLRDALKASDGSAGHDDRGEVARDTPCTNCAHDAGSHDYFGVCMESVVTVEDPQGNEYGECSCDGFKAWVGPGVEHAKASPEEGVGDKALLSETTASPLDGAKRPPTPSDGDVTPEGPNAPYWETPAQVIGYLLDILAVDYNNRDEHIDCNPDECRVNGVGRSMSFAREWLQAHPEARSTPSAGHADCERKLRVEREGYEIAREIASQARAALQRIAQYDPRWTGQHVNDAPNRAALIAIAYDALNGSDVSQPSEADRG